MAQHGQPHARETEVARGLTVQDEGDGFYLIVKAGECDLTLSLPDASAKKLADFVHARLGFRGTRVRR